MAYTTISGEKQRNQMDTERAFIFGRYNYWTMGMRISGIVAAASVSYPVMEETTYSSTKSLIPGRICGKRMHLCPRTFCLVTSWTLKGKNQKWI